MGPTDVAPDESYDLVIDEEIDRYGVLTAPAGEELQTLADLAAQIFNVPYAELNLLTSTTQHQVATTGHDPATVPRAHSLCAVVISEPGPVVVPDARQDGRFSEHPSVTGWLGSVRFYASAQVRTPSGVPIGRLCVFDDRARESTLEQHEALTFLAGRVMDVLELRLKSRQVEQSLIELTDVRDELRRSNEALLHFASQVSHDLRNPLMGVSANAELLASEPVVADDPDLAVIVDRIAEASREMSSLIQDVLSSASEGGRPQQESVALGEIMERALRDLRHEVEEKAAVITLEDLPSVPGDADLLYTVVLNLLSNALKFARRDVPPEVAVRAELRDGAWRVLFTDNGIGVPAGQERSVFRPFVRVHGDEDGVRREGHGIGLATVHRIVSAHAGHVGLTRLPGGTTVWFELPVDGVGDRAAP